MTYACPECDLLQQLPSTSAKMHCARCGAAVDVYSPPQPGRDAAFASTALILLAVANLFPILSLDLNGRRQNATVFDGVQTLWREQREELALLVLLVAVVIPFAHALCVLVRSYLLACNAHEVSLRRWALWTVRLAPWGMTEVYLLGALVAFVKLNDMATVVVGPALYAFALMSLLTAWTSTHGAGVWTALRMRHGDR